MRLRKKFELIEKKLKEMYVDGSEELAKTLPSSNPRFHTIYIEAAAIKDELIKLSDGNSQVDLKYFDELCAHYLGLWGRIFNNKANEKIKEYKDINEVPANIFRSASPSMASKESILGEDKVRLVSFKTNAVKEEEEIVYTVDELEYLKEIGLNNEACKAINTLKKMFGAAYVETPFDRIMENTQSKGAQNDRKWIHQGTSKFNREAISRRIHIPLEEQQRYVAGPT
jgi:hypothetical protein